MDQQRSEIVLSPDSWHAKLIHWVFGFGIRDFKNLCPYFWILIASILIVIPVTPIKVIFLAVNWIWEKMVNLEEQGKKRNFEKFIANLSRGEIFALTCYKYGSESLREKTNFNKKYGIIFDKISLDLFIYTGKTKPIKELINSIGDKILKKNNKWEDWYKDFNTEYEIRQKEQEAFRERAIKKDSERKKRSDTIRQITEVTKYFVKTVILIAFFLIMGVISQLALQIFVYLFTREPQDYLTFLEIIGITIALGLIGIYIGWGINSIKNWIKYKDKKTVAELALLIPVVPLSIICFSIYKILDIILYILNGIFIGIVEGFKEYGGIFADYFDASYSDYCPGINWKNNNKK